MLQYLRMLAKYQCLPFVQCCSIERNIGVRIVFLSLFLDIALGFLSTIISAVSGGRGMRAGRRHARAHRRCGIWPMNALAAGNIAAAGTSLARCHAQRVGSLAFASGGRQFGRVVIFVTVRIVHCATWFLTQSAVVLPIVVVIGL